MVHPGDKSTMLGQWRVVLRQAEELSRAGRYEDAYALISRPDVAEFRQVSLFRTRLGVDLLDRAVRRAAADDLEGAGADIALAARQQAPPDALATARHKLADRIATDLRVDFEAGDPGRVAEGVAGWAARAVDGPALRRLGEAAESWQKAQADLRRGEFGSAFEHLERAERLAGPRPPAALTSLRGEIEARRQTASPRVEALYRALADANWPAVLAAAESVLDLVPEHPTARQSRTQAWRQIGAMQHGDALFHPAGAVGGRAGRPAFDVRAGASLTASPEPPATTGASPRFLLWADTIGGFLVCLGSHVVLGRATPGNEADVPLLGDLSRRHASIVRTGDSYVVRAHHDCYINGRRVADEAPLRHGDVLRLGPSVELEFHQPSPVSATARLALVSRHRLPLAVDGILLMGETCILGPSSQAHVLAPSLTQPVVLYRQGEALWCRAPGEFEVDGRACAGRCQLTRRSSVLGDGYSFSLEPLPPSDRSSDA
jgi:tetratricopeptide (TPR) repeat protein